MVTVAVIGSGPAGLATADQLSRKDFSVLLVSPRVGAAVAPRATPVRVTYWAALAFWTPFFSGLTGEQERRQSQTTLRFYQRLRAAEVDCGVMWRKVEHYWQEGTCVIPRWTSIDELQLHRLPYGPAYLQSPEADFRWRCEYSYQAPVIDVDRFRGWYIDELRSRDNIEIYEDWPFPLAGGEAAEADPSATRAWQELFDGASVASVVLCTGAGTVYDQLCDAEQTPPGRVAFKKGVIARIPADVDPAETALLYHGGSFDREALCFVPHQRCYVLGGIVHPAASRNNASDWQVHDREMQGILARAQRFLPRHCLDKLAAAGLWRAQDDSNVEWRAGVRPMLQQCGPVVGPATAMSQRWSNLLGRPVGVFTHFGHGGSGFTLCQDTARRAVQQVAASLRGATVG